MQLGPCVAEVLVKMIHKEEGDSPTISQLILPINNIGDQGAQLLAQTLASQPVAHHRRI